MQKKLLVLSFRPGKDVSVTSIIRKPTFKKWRANIDFDEYFPVLNQLYTNKIGAQI